MKKLKKIFFVLLFCISFVCIFGQTEDISYQIPWSLGWGCLLALSGRAIGKLEDEK